MKKTQIVLVTETAEPKTVKNSSLKLCLQLMRLPPQPHKKQISYVEHFHPAVLNSKKEHLQKFNYKFPFELYVFGGNFFVGGGYSSFYWNLMAEWKLDRRAKWIYNNQNTIDQNFYKKVLEDPETLKEINKYKNEKLQIDPDYCDPEIQYKPSLMYENSYIHAAYNPEPLRYRITSHKHKDNYFVYMSIISISLLIILMSYIFHYFFKKT